MSEHLIELRNEMEESLTWRSVEYNHLKNTIKDENKFAITKPLIAMLYAHLEGFFKDCLECFIKFVNSNDYYLGELNNSLIAASLTKEFSSFEDVNRKCKELVSKPPTEDFLHKFHRRKDLTKVFSSDYLEKKVRISEKIINTKSNLTFAVWQENFYFLGLDEQYFLEYRDKIDKLVALRNGVAHGSQKETIDYGIFLDLEKEIFIIMGKLIAYLYSYCETEDNIKK